MIRLHHLAMSVADLERAIAWYGEALDLRPTVQASLPGFRLAMLEAPNGMRIEVFEAEGATRTTDSSTPTTVMRHHGYTHLALDVDEIVPRARPARVDRRLERVGSSPLAGARQGDGVRAGPGRQPDRADRPAHAEIEAAHPGGHGPH